MKMAEYRAIFSGAGWISDCRRRPCMKIVSHWREQAGWVYDVRGFWDENGDSDAALATPSPHLSYL